MNKSQIRKNISKIRKKNFSKNYNLNFDYILKILKKKKPKEKIVGGYYPYNCELDAVKILEKLEIMNFKICLPKINKNKQMDFFSWNSKEPLSINKFGIPEPLSKKILYPNIMLVPLLAFDKNLNRIGYGGGYYDRYLKKIKKIKDVLTIGLAYSFQKVKKIPTKQHDIKLDFIVTEKDK